MTVKTRLLYAEDDETLSFVTCDNLLLRGYAVEHAADGAIAMEKFETNRFDLCILDVMLPKLDGFSLAKKIREKNPHIPIIFLTARSGREDKILGLTIGGDDYITKPYSIEELVLKIEIFIKRPRIVEPVKEDSDPAKIGQFRFDSGNQRLTGGGEAIALTHRETLLLQMLASRAGSIVKREEILLNVWGNDQYYSSRSLDVFISRLRKILSPDPSIRIENIHNVGYRMSVDESK
jgi:two-component system response regulator VicR